MVECSINTSVAHALYGGSDSIEGTCSQRFIALAVPPGEPEKQSFAASECGSERIGDFFVGEQRDRVVDTPMTQRTRWEVCAGGGIPAVTRCREARSDGWRERCYKTNQGKGIGGLMDFKWPLVSGFQVETHTYTLSLSHTTHYSLPHTQKDSLSLHI